MARTILGLDPAWVGLAAGVFALLFVVKAAKWDALLAMDGVRIGLPTVLATLISANASNLLLPAKIGDTVRGVMVKRHGKVSFWYGMSSSILDRLLDFYATSLVAGLCLLVIDIPNMPGQIRTALEVAVVVALLTGLALLFSRRFFIFADRLLLHRHMATRKAMDDMVRPADALRRKWALGLLLVVVASVAWIIEGAVAYWVALAADAQVSIFIVVFAVQFANLTKAFPITPGGIGTYEAALAAILVWGGVGTELAVAIAVVDHAVKNLVTLILSFPCASYLGVRVTAPVSPSRAETLDAES